jgi:hypothetical protein
MAILSRYWFIFDRTSLAKASCDFLEVAHRNKTQNPKTCGERCAFATGFWVLRFLLPSYLAVASWIRKNQNPKEVGGAVRRQPLFGFKKAQSAVSPSKLLTNLDFC